MRSVIIYITIGVVTMFLFYFCTQYRAKKITDIKYNKENYISIRSSLQNGDLIFLAGDSPGERSCRWFSDSHFSHVGLILIENELVYILDCDVGQHSKDGVRIMLLDDKLKRYKGFKIGAYKKVIKGKDKLSHKLLLLMIEKYQEYELDHDMLSWVFSRFVLLHNAVKPKKQLFCSEFVALCLMDLGVMKNDRLPAWYTPESFARQDINNTMLELKYGELNYFYF